MAEKNIVASLQARSEDIRWKSGFHTEGMVTNISAVCKTEHKNDITRLLKGDNVTED